MIERLFVLNGQRAEEERKAGAVVGVKQKGKGAAAQERVGGRGGMSPAGKPTRPTRGREAGQAWIIALLTLGGPACSRSPLEIGSFAEIDSEASGSGGGGLSRGTGVGAGGASSPGVTVASVGAGAPTDAVGGSAATGSSPTGGGSDGPIENCGFAPNDVYSPWAFSYGDEQRQIALAVSVVPGAVDGDIAVAGSLKGTMDFGCERLVSYDYEDAFVAKLDGKGNPIWSRRFGREGGQAVSDVLLDAAGNLVLLGRNSGTIDFGQGPLTAPAGVHWDIFVAKLGPAGNVLWTYTFGIDGGSPARPAEASFDGSDGLVVAGTFVKSAYFGATAVSPAWPSIFVLRLDADGGLSWLRTFESKNMPEATTLGFPVIASDPEGNVYVASHAAGEIDFGGGVVKHTGETADVMVVKLGPSGEHLWSRAFPNESVTGIGPAIATDAGGNLFVTGSGRGTLDFGGGPMKTVSEDIYVLKLDRLGGHVYSAVFGSDELDSGRVVSTDAAGNAWFGAEGLGPLDFGGGPLGDELYWGLFVVGLDPSGAHIASLAVPGDASLRGIAVDAGGSIIVAGDVGNPAVFPSGTLDAPGLWQDAYVAKFAVGGGE